LQLLQTTDTGKVIENEALCPGETVMITNANWDIHDFLGKCFDILSCEIFVWL
jgi:hypothetical protein